jgi:hypothetical protein
MLKIFARAAKPAADFVFDIPTHKGFRAAATLPSGFELSKTFPTLKEAQIWIMRNRALARKTAAAFGRRNPAPRAYTIRNLESGKFAPYLWALVRAEYI